MLGWRIARRGLALVAIVLVGGLLSATLVRLAPGFDVDEEQLDPHLSAESVRALRETRQQERNIFSFGCTPCSARFAEISGLRFRSDSRSPNFCGNAHR